MRASPTSMDRYAAGALFTLSVGLLNYHLILSNYYVVHPSQLGWLLLISSLHGVFVCDCFKTLKDSPPLSRKHYIGMLLLVLALYSPFFLQNNQSTIAFLDSTDDSMDSFRTNNEGIFVLDAKSGKILCHIIHDPMNSSSISFDGIVSLFIDRAGLIWIGTEDGINMHNPKNRVFRTLHYNPSKKDMLSNTNIRSVIELTDGKILLGT